MVAEDVEWLRSHREQETRQSDPRTGPLVVAFADWLNRIQSMIVRELKRPLMLRIPFAPRMVEKLALCVLLLLATAQAQVIEFESSGLKYKALTHNGVTIMF